MDGRGSAHGVAILLLIVIAVSAFAVLYFLVTGTTGLAESAARSPGCPLLRAEAVKVVRAGARCSTSGSGTSGRPLPESLAHTSPSVARPRG